jgi:hypothetical protein
MNPKRSTQKVASGKVSGIGGEYKEALLPETALMQPNEDANQHVVEDVMETAVIWDHKHLKIVR